MRIAIICGGSHVGGTEVVTITVARGLRERGHDVRVLANAWTNGDFPARLADAGVPVTRVHLGKISLRLRPPFLRWTAAALVRLPGAFLAVRRWLRDFDPEVVIANNRDPVVLLGPLLRGRPLLFHMHEVPGATRATRLMYRFVAARTTTFLAVSQHVRAQLRALGVEESRTRVVYNGADVADVPPGAERMNGAPVTVGIVGHVAERKGHDDLFAALGLLRERGRSIRCLVVGDGDPAYLAHLGSIASALGVADSIEWRGFVQDTGAIFREIDVCVVPSRVEEAFGMTALEASLAGVPVLATRRGGLSEIIEDGATGLLVEAGSPRELACALERLADDALLRARLGDAARARVLGRFTTHRMVGEIEAECLRVAGAGAGNGSSAPAGVPPVDQAGAIVRLGSGASRSADGSRAR